jgi:hypothetical protein
MIMKLSLLLLLTVKLCASPLEIRFGNPAGPEKSGAAIVNESFATNAKEGARNWESEALPIGNGRLALTGEESPIRKRTILRNVTARFNKGNIAEIRLV